MLNNRPYAFLRFSFRINGIVGVGLLLSVSTVSLVMLLCVSYVDDASSGCVVRVDR